ncbi:MAG: NADPH-dependent oxidoreductase [Trueperaceae bacterium]|nr:NADPH-dependent oxidoreductase [Trueperaceae bacterium]
MSQSVIDTLNNRVSIRFYTDEPIEDALLERILQAARRAPTSSNMQTYSIIVVKNPEVKKQLAVLAGNQKHIEVCPVFLAFCADIHKLEVALHMHGHELKKSLETTLVASVDASLVGMSVQTAAESLGLGSVMIGSMRNHPKEVAELLGLPQGVYVVYGMCLGWPDKTQVPPQKPRLPQDLIIHKERYNSSDIRGTIDAHNKELAEHYESLGRNLDEAAWSGPIAQRLHKPVREELRKTLESMGFSFD